MDTKITFDKIYTWNGTFGNWFSSDEPTGSVPVGTVRCIRKQLFYAWQVMPHFKWPWTSQVSTIWWVATEQHEQYDMEDIRNFRNSL